MSKVFKLESQNLEVEIGKFARQADGAVWITSGKNVVLSTVVASKEEKDFIGFFPLTVEYRERTSAVGKIPGGYIKREGRLRDAEVLVSRLIDRPIRPLFPKFYFNEVQLISTVYSADNTFPTSILALIGSSLALTISSEIPFLGPIGAVKVGRVKGEWKFDLGAESNVDSDVELFVAGTKDGICMVEGHCNALSEAELIEAFFLAHEKIRAQVDWQLEIQKELNVKKVDKQSDFNWELWTKKVKEYFEKDFYEKLFVSSKAELNSVMSELQKELLQHFAKDIESGIISKSIILFLLDSYLKEILPDVIAKKNSRFDGRNFDEVRPIWADVGLLPCTHGSAVFQRGETQALASLTLGTAQDAQKVESLNGAYERTFMLHYNFPPLATGEVKPMRGVGRREIGHGYLAERSLLNVIPSQDKFPYTIRSVVDLLESNGSSSMATVCSTTLALMDAGVPIGDLVSGIAMGLIKDSFGKFHILTDILGIEDAFGLMDFKITGTVKGIMAVQMDIKAKSGLTKDIFQKALEQARVGRLHILDIMKKVIDSPRKELSELAPRVSSFKIAVDKIGFVIGPGGKTIKEIIAATNTQIDLEDDGTVKIYSQVAGDASKAVSWIKTLVGEIEIGTVFEGIIRRITDFGIFVELVPGKDGLVHISSIARDKQRDVSKRFKPGDKLTVKVTDFDVETGRVRLIAKDLIS